MATKKKTTKNTAKAEGLPDGVQGGGGQGGAVSQRAPGEPLLPPGFIVTQGSHPDGAGPSEPATPAEAVVSKTETTAANEAVATESVTTASDGPREGAATYTELDSVGMLVDDGAEVIMVARVGGVYVEVKNLDQTSCSTTATLEEAHAKVGDVGRAAARVLISGDAEPARLLYASAQEQLEGVEVVRC